MLQKKKSSIVGSIISLVIVAGLIVAVYFLLQHRQQISDQLTVWRYQPTAAIRGFTQKGNFSDRGTFLFYAAKPQLLSASAFSDICGSKDETTAVIGCYKNDRIYLYNIKNSDLAGIRTVTSGHEMLHVAYQRLSPKKKRSVDAMVEKEFKKIKNNATMKERLKFYDKYEPGERDNELHSIIGTEIASLSPELESYYSTYFTDRKAIVALHTSYQEAFMSLQRQSKKLVTQLDALADVIDAKKAAYQTAIAQFNARRDRYEKKNRTISDEGVLKQREKERQQLNQQVTQLQQDSSDINELVRQYNQKKATLDELGRQYSKLVKSIDSGAVSMPTDTQRV